jgi:hypothetical protein
MKQAFTLFTILLVAVSAQGSMSSDTDEISHPFTDFCATTAPFVACMKENADDMFECKDGEQSCLCDSYFVTFEECVPSHCPLLINTVEFIDGIADAKRQCSSGPADVDNTAKDVEEQNAEEETYVPAQAFKRSDAVRVGAMAVASVAVAVILL